MPLIAALLTLVSAHSAAACGPERAYSHGQIRYVTATNVGCKKAEEIVGGWWFVWTSGGSTASIYDHRGKRWRCVVTQRATGSDPGYNPYTKVRCKRATMTVRFGIGS